MDTANGGITTFLPISRSCSIDDVCLTLETLSRSQVRLEKTMKYGTDGKKIVDFIVLVFEHCPRTTVFPPKNHFPLQNLMALKAFRDKGI